MGNDYQLRILGGEASADLRSLISEMLLTSSVWAVLRSLISDILVTSSVWKIHKRLTKSFSNRLQTS